MEDGFITNALLNQFIVQQFDIDISWSKCDQLRLDSLEVYRSAADCSPGAIDSTKIIQNPEDLNFSSVKTCANSASVVHLAPLWNDYSRSQLGSGSLILQGPLPRHNQSRVWALQSQASGDGSVAPSLMVTIIMFPIKYVQSGNLGGIPLISDKPMYWRFKSQCLLVLTILNPMCAAFWLVYEKMTFLLDGLKTGIFSFMFEAASKNCTKC